MNSSYFPLALSFGLILSFPLRAEELANSPDITILHDLPYREGASKAWRLDLAMKKEEGTKPRPAIVIIHGGGWVEGDKSSFASKKHGVPGNIVEFAELGFVAVTINYRMSKEAPFPAAIEDCKAAVRWLRAHAKEYNVDKEHIGAYGNSAGGHLALMLGMTDKSAGLEGDGPYPDESSLVQAAASDSGPLDMLAQFEQGALRGVVTMFLGGPPEGDRLKLYRQASPTEHISKNTPPLLLIYGVSDNQVPVETADAFVAALGKSKIEDVTYHRLAYVDHCPHSLIRVPAMKTAVNEFFLRTLMHPETAKKVRTRK
ncbi:MAG: alpha/beta hydrolase [Planctomycetales bacterium]|nr:alpha/beta hydrolase [Planctomycetales bacterium]